jgi:hypothetical protein
MFDPSIKSEALPNWRIIEAIAARQRDIAWAEHRLNNLTNEQDRKLTQDRLKELREKLAYLERMV